MAPPMGKIMTVMARTASSNTKSGGKGSTGKARSGETKVMDAVEPSPVMGVLTKYGRDIACFILVILAVMFCASEWFRVQGVIRPDAPRLGFRPVWSDERHPAGLFGAGGIQPHI